MTGFIIITILLIVLLFLNAGGILILLIVNKRADFETYETPEKYNLNSQNIILKSEDGKSIETYHVNANDPKGYIIILSGIYSPSVTAFFSYAKFFYDLGFSSILVEMRAHGNSDGNKISLGYEEWKDVNAAVDYIDQKDSKIPIIVFGTSMGGSVSIISTSLNSRINGVVSQSAFSSIEENIMDLFQNHGIPKCITLLQMPFTKLLLGMKYGFAKIKITPKNNISKIDSKNTLLIHSEKDSQVSFNNFIRLKSKCSDEVQAYIVEGDEHFIVNQEVFENPMIDKAYSNKIISFLNGII